ncbi:cytochrome P450 81Q32-like isoform X2 [Pistacia vera]|uniref:cytochrome P450 81Q32-like isoform X2 n=1 Tax=Pistacia vera TaxID=55513 RepID=UPI001263859E|nr:cytochrome P450 81Q32-like isoform X2 [Pistacia vera]
MEKLWSFIFSASFFLFLFLILKHFLVQQTQYKNLPPSPPSFPIIGHLYLLKQPIHRTLQHLSNKYGPILNLSFGYRRVLLVSSPSAVEECFTKSDIIFANRSRLLAGKYLTYDYTTMVAAPYGHHWRTLRRLAALEFFSTSRLNMFLGIRQDEIMYLVKMLYQSCGQSFTKVEIKSKLFVLSFNIIMRMVSGKRYLGIEIDEPEEAKRLREIVRDIFEVSGASNPGDFLPFLRWLGYQSYEKRVIAVHSKSDGFMQNLIDEHRNKRNCSAGERRTDTIIDSMLSLQESQPEYYSDEIIKGMIMTLLLAGTDTSAATKEWAISLLLNHPVVLKKARAELDNLVGHDRLVEEPDLAKLHYLQCIINETLRLFPAAPLLVPHESSDFCTIGGYDVPPSTMLFVNAWAIHRDPNVWEDSTSFKPERFEGLEGVSEAYNFIPFGQGRRSCPGAGLANKVMGLTLATLIQCFEWERISEEEVDMTEGTGITMPKAKPLQAMFKARESMFNVLSKL